MTTPESGTPGLAADVELDLLLLSAKASTLHALDMALDIAAATSGSATGPRPNPQPRRTSPGYGRTFIMSAITRGRTIATAVLAASTLLGTALAVGLAMQHQVRPAPWDDAVPAPWEI